MANLYTNKAGKEIKHVSHSSGNLYSFCRRKFKLEKIDGWKEKGKKAALEFGKCIEDSIQYFHDNGCKPDDALDTFIGEWEKWRDQELIYTDQEGNFFELGQMGREMMRLYEVVSPTLPIRNPKWQLEFRKQLWPGTELSDIEFLAYVDLLSILEDGTKLIVDIKTAKSSLDLTPNMLAMDAQLRKYAWVSGCPDVGFMCFVKAKASVKKGDRVTLLSGSLEHTAGAELEVFKYDKDTDLVYMGLSETVRLLDEELDPIKGKGSTEAKDSVVASYLADLRLIAQPKSAATKTRLQFIRARIDPSDFPEIGQQIGHQVMQIRQSEQTGQWFMDSGVKFPDQKCTWCSYRGICLRDNGLRDAMLVQISPAAKPEPDWLDVEVE